MRLSRVTITETECKRILNEIVRLIIDKDKKGVRELVNTYRRTLNYQEYEQMLIDQTELETVERKYCGTS